MPQIVTDEIASLIWSGGTITPDLLKDADTAGAAATQGTTTTQTQTNQTDATGNTNSGGTGEGADDASGTDDKDNAAQGQGKPDLITAALAGTTTDDDDDDGTDDAAAKAGAAKKGRKPSDLVSLVNKMIESEELLPFDGETEVKTVDEARELIKGNFRKSREEGEEEGWKAKVKGLSPQVQAILHYADQGAQTATELLEFMGAIKNMEEAYEYDGETPEGQETIVRQYYKSKGFKDNYIEKQINLLKDAGADKIKEESEQFLPELVQMNEAKVKEEIAKKENSRKQAEEASRAYLGTVQKALESEKVGEVKLTKDEKARVYEAVANPRFKSLTGAPTTEFVKRLEQIQFGSKDEQNYQHFLNVVHYTVDPEGFMKKMKESLETQVNGTTQREIRSTKKVGANTPDNTSQSGGSAPRKGVVRSDFKNPFN